MTITADSIFDKSDQVTAREIEGEFVIVPISKRFDGVWDELFFLNETGRELWENLDGKTTIADLVEKISSQYRANFHELIRKDVFDLISDLLEHGIIIKKK